jgi:disulfide bond formation protein DsbB
MMNIQKWMLTQWFWGLWVLLGVILESTALYYQYVLNEPPCVLCIQFRLLMLLLIIMGLLGVFLRHKPWARRLLSFSLLLTCAGMLERSYQLLGTERGFVIGECNMDLGLPQWFAIQEWISSIFEIQTTCGYTPIIAWGISMAESLAALSIVLFIVASLMLLLSFKK